MSPDEGISESLGITPWGTVTKLLRAYGHAEHIAEAMAKQIDDVYAAHRASGEGGSTSALRASAPEGISTPPPSAHTTMLLNTIGRQRDQIADLKATIAHERQQHAEASEKHATEYHRIATALGCHVHDDLAAKAAQSRGANAPSSPEGISDREAIADLIAKNISEPLGPGGRSECLSAADAVLSVLRARGRLVDRPAGPGGGPGGWLLRPEEMPR